LASSNAKHVALPTSQLADRSGSDEKSTRTSDRVRGAARPAEGRYERATIDEAPADIELGQRRARAAALLMLALPGSAHLYQGEKLGLWEVEDLPEGLLQDPTWNGPGPANVAVTAPGSRCRVE